jgi:hypothetical protein
MPTIFWLAQKGWCYQPSVSISSTFYEQLLHVQTPKAQKKTVKLKVLFALLGSALIKAARQMLVI